MLLLRRTIFCCFTFLLVHASSAQNEADGVIRVSLDARNLPRKLLDAKVTIPLEPSDQATQLALWYPKWVPGSHGPGGPIANVVGLKVRTAAGDSLGWKRSPGEVYRINVDVPAKVDALEVELRYVTDQPTTTSFGHDCFTSEHISVISPGCLLMYPEGINIDERSVALDLHLPTAWRVATALQRDQSLPGDDGVVSFADASMRRYVDSPIMIGRYYRTYDLVEAEELCPPHTLHVFADSDEGLEVDPDVLTNYRSMVTQTAHLVGSHPFPRFDILLAITSALPKNGLEHARSTMNVLPPSSLRSASSLKGWDRLLVPHEYLHAWCGKYRRPAGMATTDFHTPKDTELLWVYEGLTQYLGELVEARSHMMSDSEFRDRLFVELRAAMHQQGRQWRPLADTAAASHILRDGSSNWGALRRSQDYYMEGMLFWLEADARIRQLSEGRRSLDDFCHLFFAASDSDHIPNPYSRAEIVKLLQSIAPLDWDGLISRRVESLQQSFDPQVASLLGYQFVQEAKPPRIPASTFRRSGGVDLLDSIGMTLSNNGEVRRILLDSPADVAQLAPGDEIVGIDGEKFSAGKLNEAIEASKERQPIKLLVARGEHLTDVHVQYFEGPRYWNLKRDESKSDLLSEILAPVE